MNLKQNSDNTYSAYFKAEELPQLVAVVKEMEKIKKELFTENIAKLSNIDFNS